ncbi:excisionase [Pantoea agglomerans]|uniref:Excisionase n=1 Tax=Enterobacter agglomerans TaxID=549 RepID=A0ACC5PWE4_ENTAG|nr:excisionase [Pantoea agglomerans]MBD8129179.1 excisionase [Pantoea agglomerans]MBD8153768.1 excisionase [Pantoea agglomerans]MBD8157785.1 excisionase [Pantoea agglomerans]MBD8231623.1 excisionase [Pantoea agglomerans]MBD8241683.1 excisionase [Pantoea agglomerans]
MKRITLKRWAELNYEPPLPSINSLYIAAQNKRFNPPAEKEFGYWRVWENAVLNKPRTRTRESDPPELLRILNDGKTP